MPGPLSGVRILDFTVLTAGAEATGFLCDLGAEILKVEPLNGEVGRRLTPQPGGESTFFLPQNRGKRGIAIDLKQPEGRELALKLAATCDAVASNFRVGAMEALGLGYGDFCRVNPGIVVAEGTSYGPEGPDRELESVDVLGQARSGVMSVTGESYPTPAGFIMSDYIAAMHLALGLLAALIHQKETGEGQRVQGSMLGSMINAQGWEMTHYLVGGGEPRRGERGHHLLSRGVWGTYDTADGHISLASMPPDKLGAVAEALDAPALAEFAALEPAARLKRGAEFQSALRSAVAKHPSKRVYRTLLGLGVRCAPIQTYAQVAADPQVLANNYIVEIEHPKLGRTRMTGNPLAFSKTPIALSPVAPGIGQHTEELMREAGYTDEDIAALLERGVVAQEAK